MAKLDSKAFGLSLGIVWGTAMFFLWLTAMFFLWLTVMFCNWGGAWVTLIPLIYIGYKAEEIFPFNRIMVSGIGAVVDFEKFGYMEITP
jgi:hypothetical protein